jgi:hypothetical protein
MNNVILKLLNHKSLDKKNELIKIWIVLKPRSIILCKI